MGRRKYAYEREQDIIVSVKERTIQYTIFDPKMQKAIDDYLILHRTYKEAERTLKSLRETIEAYMDENLLDEVFGKTVDGSIKLEPMERPVVTSQYSYYNIDVLKDMLHEEQLKKIVKEVVDREIAEALITLGEIEEDVLKKSKIVNETKRFRCIHNC